MFKLLFTSLLLLTPVSLFAGPCYLVIEDSGNYNPARISHFAISVMSQYIGKISPVPPAGISAKSCQYRLSVSETRESLTVAISGNDMNAFGDSNNPGFAGVQEAILRAIYRANPARKSDICTAYSTMIPFDCGQKSSPTIVSPTTLPPPKVLSSPLFDQSEKPQTIIVPTGSLGEISEVRKKMLEKSLESKLDDYFAIVPKDMFEEAQEQAFQEMESDECTEEQCIRMIRDILQVENSFQMVLMVEEENTQISLTWNDLDQKRVEVDYCEGCKTKQLTQSIEGLVDKMFDTYKVKMANERNKETNALTQISANLNPLTTQVPPLPAALPSSDNEWVEPFTEMIFVQIPGDCFQMGSNHKNSGPIHEVCVGDFYLGKYEVTQGEWQKVMGRNPSKSKNSSRHPVEMVSYYDIQEFITNLNSKGNTNFRLPYEAEWEYAAKGGKRQFQYSTKNGSINSSSVNFDSEGIFSIGFLLRSSEDGFKHSAPVGSFPLNFFGIADMTGNLWEWIHDYYGKAYYASGTKNNPKGPEKGEYRIFRGGSWNDSNVDYLSTSFRYLKKPGYKNSTVGFRLAIQN